ESQINMENLNSEEKSSIQKICKEYNDVLFVEGDSLSMTNATMHSIPIPENANPINTKPYRLPESMKEVINSEVSNMLNNHIIRSSTSPWNSPLLVVPKKSIDGEKKYRVVVDYRRLNDITIGSVFPLPNINEILDQLGKASYFSTLDLANGYHQIPIIENDREKTAFSTNEGHYEFNRMPFGLKGAPATFQRMMNNVLAGVNGIKCFVYLDDIVIYGYDLKDHNSRLINVLQLLRKYNLKLQAKKCNFLRKEINYLGHIISTTGIKPDPSKIESVSNFPTPQNQKQIKSFLGLASYYRKFINNFSSIAQPLTDRLRKTKSFIWDCHCDDAFKKLKIALTNAPILQYPDFEKPFLLTVDASDYAIGAILSQKVKINGEEEDLPIAYASRVLNTAERHYPTIKKECLAIIFAVRKFRPYIYGRKFIIITDHRPLVWLKNIANPASILIRWRLELEEYDYEIKHKSGILNSNADALSRICPQSSDCNVATRAKYKKDIQNPTYFKFSESTHNSNIQTNSSQSNQSNSISNYQSNSNSNSINDSNSQIQSSSENSNSENIVDINPNNSSISHPNLSNENSNVTSTSSKNSL
ncbi:MAG TPA: hypothetical protein DDZ41_08570, partial [Flavobacterium sp.]|nr:hypothetical protein [Flavobacterium sp.]